MKQEMTLTHEFVEYIPSSLKDGKIYVSLTFATAIHKCCCGCGKDVVTPLSPTDWKLIFDGQTISLHPSIGNWSFACKSHYWIKCNRIKWASRWSQEDIEAGRIRDRDAKEEYFETTDTIATGSAIKDESGTSASGSEKRGFWCKLKKWWSELTRKPQ